MATLKELQAQWEAGAQARAELKARISDVKARIRTLEWQAENPNDTPEHRQQFLEEAAALRGDA